MGIAQYDVVGIGEAELRYGLGFLRSQIKAHDLPAVSANLVYLDSGDYIVEPYSVVKRGGFKVGVTAVSGELESFRGKESLKDWRDQNVTLSDPETALTEVIDRMRQKEKVDLVIVLSHMGYEEGAKLGEAIPGIDVWIEAHNRGRMVTPEKKGETIYAACRGRSSGYGELYLSLAEEGAVSNFVGRAGGLTSKGRSDEAALAVIMEFKQAGKKPTRRVRKADQPVVDAAMVSKDTFVSAESCRKCHAGVYESWAMTGHASAYATIAETAQWNDPDCLICHTTGYGEMSDPESGMIEPKFWNVQCESCHGMGTQHSRHPGAAEVPEHVCLECHNQSNSPEFDYDAYVEHIVHH